MKISGAIGRAFGIVAVLSALATLIGTGPAAAVEGQAIVAGDTNSETSPTVLSNPDYLGTCQAGNPALTVCGDYGLEADGNRYGVVGFAPTGVLGSGATTGVEGDTKTGSGVLGTSFGATGIGVEGVTLGSGSALYGVADANGVGVFGDTANGTGVLARSTNGNALDVRGKATFSRSGLIVVTAGSNGKTVTLAGVTKASMVLATAQQDGAVYVRSAVPGNGQFTIHLTGPAPTGGLKVSYFVLN